MAASKSKKKKNSSSEPELMPEDQYKELIKENKKKLDEAGRNHKSLSGLHGR